jgi:hypothetical protein
MPPMPVCLGSYQPKRGGLQQNSHLVDRSSANDLNELSYQLSA